MWEQTAFAIAHARIVSTRDQSNGFIVSTPVKVKSNGWQRQAEPAELADGLGAYTGAIGKLAPAAATHRKS